MIRATKTHADAETFNNLLMENKFIGLFSYPNLTRTLTLTLGLILTGLALFLGIIADKFVF